MTLQPTRREFLAAVPAVGAGVWIASAPARAQQRSPNEKLNVAVIGCGGRGSGHVASAAGQNLVALCDVDQRRAARAFERHPKVPKFADFRRMFDKLHKQIDCVFVATPDHTHAVASVAAMKLGKHVYCEKPLAHDVYECRVMADLARERKLATQMGNQGHSGKGYRRMVAVVRSGAIGTVREAHAWCPKNFSATERPAETPPVPTGLDWDLWVGPAPMRPYHPSYVPFNWRERWDFGTGGLGDMACHILDPIFTALELGLPSRVEAEGEPKVNPEGFAKHLTVKYTFPARSGRPGVTVFWHHGDHIPPRRPVGGVQLPADFKLPESGQMLIGDKGILVGRHSGGLVALLPREKFANYTPPEIGDAPSHTGEWFEACRTGKPTGSNFAYAAAMTEAVLLGNAAWRVGQPLDWDGDRMRAPNCPEADRYLRREYRKGWDL